MNIFEKIILRSIDADRFAEITNLPKIFLNESISTYIPSLKMSNEGPVLTSIFLITENYLCEVAIPNSGAEIFDAVDLRKVQHIKVESEEVTVDLESGKVLSYRKIKFEIRHFKNLLSVVEYSGGEAEEWFKEVMKFLPVSILLGRD